MKHYLSIFLLFFLTGLYGQDIECSANAGGDDIICFTDGMNLSAPIDQFYDIPPNITWTYEDGPLLANQLIIANNNAFNTAVTTVSGLPWDPGVYRFKFCVNCADNNGDGIIDRTCDDVLITVKPDVTQPLINELDDAQDGIIKVCREAIFNVNTSALAPGETYSIVPNPKDGFITVSDVGGVVTARVNVAFSRCTYDIVYTITNLGCERTETVEVRFINPEDPDFDGTIEGRIEECPACSTTVKLIGDRPGCGGEGAWSIVGSPPGASVLFDPVNLVQGTATATVSVAGHYTFAYSVTNIAPCSDSYFLIECDVLEVGNFTLGPNQTSYYCGGIVPAGTYSYCFEELENAIYYWTPSLSGVVALPNNSNCADLILANDIPVGNITVEVTAVKFFIDPDCGGPLLPEVLPLPYLFPNETEEEIEDALKSINACYSKCRDVAYVYFFGAPYVEVKSSDISFLCSDGSEVVKLNEYFKVTGVLSYSDNVTVLSQPSCSSIGPTFSAGQLINLNVNNCGGCGVFEFRVDLVTTEPVTYLPSACTTSIYITIRIETSKPVTAGTDQVKCPGELTSLNGNNEYCSAVGIWKQINCSNLDYYVVTIDEVHNPNTEIFVVIPIDSICPPDTLCFVWSFNSDGDGCDLSDTTRVFIKDDCCGVPPPPNCPEHLHVVSNCVEGSITLTVVDDLLGVIDPAEYVVHWSPMNLTGNPVTFPYTGPVHYTVEIYDIIGGDTICYTVLTGTERCNPEGCDAHIVESCTPNGDIIISLLDANNNLIPPTTYEYELWWTVYGGGANDDDGYPVNQQNPIIIQQDACYSLVYRHYIYPNGVPHVFGYQTGVCVFELPKTCVSIECPGPCSGDNDFFIAGCGDILDLSLNLTFPPNCQNVCSSNQIPMGTLGVFHKSTNLPVNPSLYTIRWRNNAMGTYVTGNLNLINEVSITTNSLPECPPWKDRYGADCPCTTVPTSLHCEQPITKYCRPDGSFYYIVGPPQIVWIGVPGATSYTLEVTTGSIEGCCTMPPNVIIIPNYMGTSWSIPPGLQCFTIRIRANSPYCQYNPPPAWSAPYVYCPQEVVCDPVITVCGCCHGDRTEEATGLPIKVVSEETLLAYLSENPGTEYTTLRDALKAAGVQGATGLEFIVFPNPASDQIVVKAGNNVEGIFTIQLTDLFQRQWRNESFDAVGQKALNIADLPPGVYLVTIRNAHGDRMLTEKIAVMR